jgi:hypothetical protein
MNINNYILERGNIYIAYDSLSLNEILNNIAIMLKSKVKPIDFNINRIYELYLVICHNMDKRFQVYDDIHFLNIAYDSFLEVREFAMLCAIFQNAGGGIDFMSKYLEFPMIALTLIEYNNKINSLNVINKQDYSSIHNTNDCDVQYDIFMHLKDEIFGTEILLENLKLHYISCREYFDIVVDIYEKILRRRGNEIEIQNALHDICPEKYKLIDNILIYNIDILPFIKKIYILGFPVHIDNPSEEEVNERMSYLSSNGIDMFCEKYISSAIIHHHKHINNHANTTDTLWEQIRDYNQFDVIRYYEGKFCYYFTRSEFDTLLSKHQNVWNRQPLSDSILFEIQNRLNLSKTLMLPKCKTIKAHLKEMSDHTILRLKLRCM